MNSLLKACRASEIKQVVGGKLNKTTDGITLVIDKSVVPNDWPPTLYDQTKKYARGDWIWVKPSSSAVTTGIRDIVSGNIVQASPGLYRARVAIAPGTVTVSGSPVAAYYIPQVPEPNTDDITASTVKWIYLRGVASC